MDGMGIFGRSFYSDPQKGKSKYLEIMSHDRKAHKREGPISDEELREEASEVLYSSIEIDATYVDISVSDGVVSLYGSVENSEDKETAERLMRSIPDIHGVQNHLGVRGASYREAG